MSTPQGQTGFFERLKCFYTSIGASLAADRDISAVMPNPTDKGLRREEAYAEVLAQLLPTSCNVKLGGYLFGHTGDESAQVDIFVQSDMALQYAVQQRAGPTKAFSCIDGTVGVVCVKSRLDAAGLTSSLDCLDSLPEKLPLEGRAPQFVNIRGYPDWPYKVVFAFDGVGQETALAHIEEYYATRSRIPPMRQANLIHVLGKYCIIRTAAAGEQTRLGQSLGPNTFVIAADDPDFLGLAKAITNMHRIAMSMRWMKTDYAELFDKTPLPGA
jgi:hypothetical protein